MLIVNALLTFPGIVSTTAPSAQSIAILVFLVFDSNAQFLRRLTILPFPPP
jgi:hypothetical protein